MYKFILIGLAGIVSIVNATAATSNEMQLELIKIIKNNCHDTKILVRNSCLSSTDADSAYEILPSQNIDNYVKLIGKAEFARITGNSSMMGSGCDGYKRLKCGSHNLDISGNDYLWDNIEISPPKNINIATNNTGPVMQLAGSTYQPVITNNTSNNVTNITLNKQIINLEKQNRIVTEQRDQAKKTTFSLRLISTLQPIILICLPVFLDKIKFPKKRNTLITITLGILILVFTWYVP